MPKATSEQIVEVTYDELSHLIGRSRSLINQGLQRLISHNKITFTGLIKRGFMFLTGQLAGGSKLPCRAIFSKNGAAALKTFTLRSKHELHALTVIKSLKIQPQAGGE